METNASQAKVIAIAVALTLLLTALVLVHYNRISQRQGSLVIPAGNTYLGPNPPKQGAAPPAPTTETVFTASPDAEWVGVHGRIYPYTFRAPATLKLIALENDLYDMYAIDCCGVAAGSNVLIGVDPKVDPKQTKLAYVQNWWRQFSGLKSVASIEQFTNDKGLKGYKAKYVNSSGESPNLDVFFEVPEHPNYIIHLASGTLNTALFATIVDSVSWGL